MAQPLLLNEFAMTDTFQEKITSPFFNVLSEADSIQVREVDPTTHPAILASLDQAIKHFEHGPAESSVRSFLVTITQPPPSKTTAQAKETQSTSELETVLNKAEILLKNQDYLLARNLYSFILKKDIQNPFGLKGLGICLFNLGDLNAARKCFTALIEVHGNIEGRALLGISFVKELNDLAAYENFAKIKDPSHLSPDLRFNFFKEFGNSLTRMDRLNEASDCYHQALSLNPRSHTILINLGTLEIQRKRFDKATKYFQQAIDFCPKAAKAFCGIGIVAQMTHENEIARIYFQKTLDVDCQNNVALNQLYTLAETPKAFSSLKIQITQALIKEPANLENRYLLAAVLLKQNDLISCENELNFILKKSPEHSKAKLLSQELSTHKHRQGANL